MSDSSPQFIPPPPPQEYSGRNTGLIVTVLLAMVLLGAGAFAMGILQASDDDTGQQSSAASDASEPFAADMSCDESLWARVEHVEQLSVLQSCAQVSGTILGRTSMGSGELLRLQPDAPSKTWLAQRGVQLRNGELLIESFEPSVDMPADGARVRVVGALVTHSSRGWNQMYPVTRITTM